LVLEAVALNQTRFNTPGIAPDNRGVVLGKQCALLFASVDRLVGFFRVFCDESSLDELLPKLKIHQVRTPLESREFLVLFAATSSYLGDRAARIAGLFGGLAFTGSGKHYVKYRDARSPLGYDVAALHGEPADFVLYADAFVQGYARVKDLPFDQLLLRLSLMRLPGGSDGESELLWLSVREGLGALVIGYLWRNRVKAEAGRVVPEGRLFGARDALLLLRVHELPRRMLELFSRVPGVEVYRPVGDGCVVEIGWRHPFRLEACGVALDKTRLYVFSGTRDRVDVLPLGPLVPAHDLVGRAFQLQASTHPLALAEPERLSVELRLVRAASPSAVGRVTATLVPWERADWLRRLVYALPPTLLAGYRVAAIAEGLFIVGEQGIDGLPIGQLFQEAAPSIFVPAGTEFLPRVSGEVLTDHLGGVAGRYLVFPPLPDGAARPLALDHAAFEPLGRRALARVEVDARPRDPRMPAARTATPATVINENLSLWSFRPHD
jgi:hypothetical protein